MKKVVEGLTLLVAGSMLTSGLNGFGVDIGSAWFGLGQGVVLLALLGWSFFLSDNEKVAVNG